MRPTDTLKAEHRNIEKTLSRVIDLCDAASLDKKAVAECISFIRNYADKRHHGKEEAMLFPAMAERGFPLDSGPLACMLSEHDLGRKLVGRAVAGLEADDHDEVKEALRQFVGLLTDHIKKEDQILFSLADNQLTEDDQISLEKRFAEFDAAFDKNAVA